MASPAQTKDRTYQTKVCRESEMCNDHTYSNFIIPIALQPDVVKPLIF